jgi:septum site-determining protein MinD
MAKIISVLSGKGGVGKTTTAINIAYHIEQLDEDAIVVDGNLYSPNLALHLGSDHYPITIHDVLADEHRITNAVYQHTSGVKVVPGEPTASNLDHVEPHDFHQHITDLHLHADYIIIDGTAELSDNADALVEHSDEILLITTPDRATVTNTRRVERFVQDKNGVLNGVVLNKYRWFSFSDLAKTSIQKHLDAPIVQTIPHHRKFRQALHQREPFSHRYPWRKPTRSFKEIASHITNRV